MASGVETCSGLSCELVNRAVGPLAKGILWKLKNCGWYCLRSR